MDYRTLGRTGVQVSPLTFGTMQLHELPDEAAAARLLDAALDAGVNSVDTANGYGRGASEELVGRLLRRNRRRDHRAVQQRARPDGRRRPERRKQRLVPTGRQVAHRQVPVRQLAVGFAFQRRPGQRLGKRHFTDQSAAVVDALDGVSIPGRAVVPYYLDDDFADWKPSRFRW